MSAVLELRQLSKTIKNGTDEDTILLNGINLTVNKRDFVTVLGGNGAGKSTLFNSISGSTTLSSGQIFVEGKNMNRLKEEKRANYIARVFQDPKTGTAPRMTVAENLLLASKRGKNRLFIPRKIKEYRALFSELCKGIGNGLEKHLDTPTAYLSGGQRQSLSLLMATLTDPALLLLDEHTAALDPKTSKRLMELTQTIIEERHLTCLMITHRMEDALKYGNRLIVLEKGEIKHDLNESEKSRLTLEDLFRLFEREEAPIF